MSNRYPCNTCGLNTVHVVHHTKSFEFEDELEPGLVVHESVAYQLCTCAGCESVVVVTETVGDTTNGEEVLAYFPVRSVRKRPRWLSKFALSSITRNDPKYPFFNEIYDALDNGSLRLAILGIRSLVEHVMLQQLGDEGSFRKNLAAFHSAGHISKPQFQALEHVIELGHAVTHRAHAPTRDQVLAALDVTESIIQAIYVDHGTIVAAIAKKKPPDRR